MTARVFASYGAPLALMPQAFGMMVVAMPEPPKARVLDGGIAIVDVRGPLMHHADPCVDSYDAIKARVAGALDEGAKAVILSVDSPGGLVSGCFDTADEIRALCDARGVPLIGYVDGCAASAAYGLICAASKVFVPPTGLVGSIGVLDAVIDETTRDRAMGISYTLVTSGARKADGNPHVVATDSAVAAVQTRVTSLAAVFHDHVARHRSADATAIAGLEAALFVGAESVRAGLADEVATLDQVVALVRGASTLHAAASASSNEVSTMTDEEQARAALQAIVDDEKSDDKAKARAKAALAAFDDDGEPDGDEKKDDEAKAAKAEGDDEKHEEPDGDEAKAQSGATALLARVERVERTQILASRPDLTADQRKALASVPVTALEAVLAAIPRAPVKPAALGGSLAATRGEGQSGPVVSRANITPDAALDRAFGMAAGESPIRKDEATHKMLFGVLTREQAKAITSKHGGAQ